MQRYGRSIEQFDISATPRTLDDQSGALSADRGTVTIRNRETGTTRTYPTGHASSWVAEFSTDVKFGLLDADPTKSLSMRPCRRRCFLAGSGSIARRCKKPCLHGCACKVVIAMKRRSAPTTARSTPRGKLIICTSVRADQRPEKTKGSPVLTRRASQVARTGTQRSFG